MPSVDKHVHLFYTSSIKLSQYAKQQGIRYRRAFRWFRTGTIKGYQTPSGTIIVTVEKPQQTIQKVAMYARQSWTGSPHGKTRQRHAKRKTERIVQESEADAHA